MPDEIIMIDEWVDELPVETHLIVIQRACQKAGIWCELQPDGVLQFDEDADMDVLEEACVEELRTLYATRLLEDMTEDGEIRPDGVHEDGTIRYVSVKA